MKTSYRTHTCGELRQTHTGEEVRLTGWVDRRRDYGKLLFVDVRDRYGKIQIVFGGEGDESLLELATSLRHEFVVQITGTVKERIGDAKNPKLATGDVEVHATKVEILNKSITPPFDVNLPDAEGDELGFELRLKNRVLDLRRPAMQRRLLFRHEVITSLRHYFDDRGFAEIETPILTRATPEGARDYLVPSRVTQGSFYALPQSPQLFKQLLMIGGYDRYYQVARCFRDEDLRADRQPEFTQLDLELSFVDEEDVYRVLEGAMAHVFKAVLGKELATPFRRIAYDEALLRYGIDKPDLRFGLEIEDITTVAAKTEVSFLRDPALHKGGAGERDGAVRAIRVPGGASRFSRKDLDGLNKVVQPKGAGGVAWLKVGDDGALSGSVKKFFQGELGDEIKAALGAEGGDLLIMVADKNSDVTAAALGAVRLHVASKLGLIDKTRDEFCWIVDFPYFEHDPETNTYIACRHPFTTPRPEDVAMLSEDPLKVHAIAYDLVMNGTELGSGSIRIHDADLQRKVLNVLGYDEAESVRRFGFLLECLTQGAPPHGGAAIGLDRFTAMLQGLTNLREVVAFPKTAKATCLLTGAPSTVEPDQLEVLAIRSVAKQPKTD